MKFPLFFNIILIAAVPLFAAVPLSGGDATIYEAYRENLDKDREQAVHYAEMYLGSLEDGIADSVSAEMASFLADWWGNEKFLFSKAIRWEEGLLDYYIREDNPCRIAETESRLAGLYYKTGYYHKTLRYANSARYHFERCEDTVGLLNVYNLLGQVYFVCNDYRTAEKYFISFEQGARARNDSVMLVKAINNMSLLPRKRNDFEKARLLIGKSIELSKSIGDSSLFFRGYLNLTASYIDNPDTLGLKTMTDSLGRFSGYARTHEDKGLYYYTIGASELRQEIMTGRRFLWSLPLRSILPGNFSSSSALAGTYCIPYTGIWETCRRLTMRWKSSYQYARRWNTTMFFSSCSSFRTA